MSDLFDRIYAVVQQIPEGRVATYGQVAWVVGIPRGARTIGWAMHSLPEGVQVPWWRVINGRGCISAQPGSPLEMMQRGLLEGEGVVFDANGKVDLAVVGWDSPETDSAGWSGARGRET